jgi:hypothetical protein
MSWGPKYQLEFKDIWGLDWKSIIYEWGYGGGVTDLVGADDAIQFDFDTDSDDLFDPIKETHAKINVMSQVNFALSDLYSVEDLYFLVAIYQGVDLYFLGYIDNSNFTEPYEDVPYPVTISVTDGLSCLKEILFDNSGVYYNGRMSESEIIYNILDKISIGSFYKFVFTNLGETLMGCFYEFINLFEVNMQCSINDSPLDQCYIDVDVFKDMYCLDVLSEILKKYGAIIRQWNGVFYLIRPVELKTDLIYGRYFTDGSSKSSVSYTSEQFINRVTHPTNILQVAGGVKMITGPAKKVTINQDYGNKESWIDNWQFLADTFDGTDFEYWTQIGGSGFVKQLGDYIPNEKDGVLIIFGAYSLSQIFGSSSLANLTDLMILEFEYGYFNTHSAPLLHDYLYIRFKQGLYYLEELSNGYVDWTLTPSTITIDETVEVGWSDWKTYKRQFTGLYSSGDIEVILYPTSNSYSYSCYRNIKFSASSSKILEKEHTRSIWQRMAHGAGIQWMRNKYYNVKYKEATDNIVQKKYVKTNAINGSELQYDVLLGDVVDSDIINITEQFKGALGIHPSTIDLFEYSLVRNTEMDNTLGLVDEDISLIPSTYWSERNSIEKSLLLDFVSDEITYQRCRPIELIQMAIQEDFRLGIAPNISMISNFQDDLNTCSGVKKLIPNAGKFSIKGRQWSVDMIEIIYTQVVFEMCFIRNQELDNTLVL